MAAWADTIDITNQGGSVTFTDTGGVTTIVSKGSELTNYNGIKAPKNHALGTVSFSTGAFTGSSIWTGGTFSSVGSTFDAIGIGQWAKTLTGQSKNPITLFSGSFVGPIAWTVVSHIHDNYVFTLSGAISGMFYNGRIVTGTTTQTIYAYTDQEPYDHKGSIHMGSTQVTVPEPGTLGLLGTGLITLAGAMRRKLFKA